MTTNNSFKSFFLQLTSLIKSCKFIVVVVCSSQCFIKFKVVHITFLNRECSFVSRLFWHFLGDVHIRDVRELKLSNIGTLLFTHSSFVNIFQLLFDSLHSCCCLLLLQHICTNNILNKVKDTCSLSLYCFI